MKDTILAVLILTALVLVFSTEPVGEPAADSGGVWAKRPGNSGTVLPGGGDQMAEDTAESQENRETKRNPAGEPAKGAAENCERKETEGTEEMNGWLYFWCGVTAVLMGETVALMVAAAWMKIYIQAKRHTPLMVMPEMEA